MRVRSVIVAAVLIAAANAAIVLRDVEVRQDIVIDKRSPSPSQSAQPTQTPQPLEPLPQNPPKASQASIPNSSAPASPTASVAPVAPPAATPAVPTSAASPSPSAAGTTAEGATTSNASRRSNSGVVAGAVVAALLLVALVVVLLCVVFRGRNSRAAAARPEGKYSSDPSARAIDPGATPVAGSAAAGTRAPPAGENSDGGTIQDIDLAEAEASMPQSYVVSDAARHHGAAPIGAVAPAPAGAGEAGAVLGTDGREPSPPPHDYVVGAGPITSKTDFDDIKTRFARDEIGDSTAILGANGGDLIEAAPEKPAIESAPAVAAAAVVTDPEPAKEAEVVPPPPATSRSIPPPPPQPAAPVSDNVPDAPTPPSFNGEGDNALSASLPASSATEEVAPPADLAQGAPIPDTDMPITVEAPRSAVEATYEVLTDETNLAVRPDRPIEVTPISFDVQDKLSHSAQDLSGSVSEAVPSLTSASIAEERAVTASLDRDSMPTNK